MESVTTTGGITTSLYNTQEIRAFTRDCFYVSVKAMLNSGQNLVGGTVLGQITTSGNLTTYDHDNSDGSEVAVGVLARNVNASSGDTECELFVAGYFVASLIDGMDSFSYEDLKARNIPGGIIKF